MKNIVQSPEEGISENVNVTCYLKAADGRIAISESALNEWPTSMVFNMDAP